MFNFSSLLVQWQQQHGRHHLPWQVEDPYCVWVSEIMLQQTQVTTVLDYYPQFIQRFPNVQILAQAEAEEVMSLWSGLGYYSRARNLHKAARQIMSVFNGQFPQSREALETLCGVGRSTAAAITAFSFHARETILDGNVKRVLTRVFAISGIPSDRLIEQQLWQLAETLLPNDTDAMPTYIQGLMDLGAMLCTRSKPKCLVCPMQKHCRAMLENRINELPARKPKKAVPERHFLLLLIRYQNLYYFERRPASGIWGGLLCLPECKDSHVAQSYIDTLGEGELNVSLPEMEHILTHFRLIITPQPAHMITINHLTGNGKWLTPEAAITSGVPTAVKKILAQLT